MALLGKSLFWG